MTVEQENKAVGILERNLDRLEEASKKDCSGEDLKAITEAMQITIHTLCSYFG